ncbi:ATP-binding protein, partial [Roseisolibacter sp. H3M3-2]|uniref:ATP-binding protein n=1 Tax=Roseisolibacter sp. H3M3-2 TaxID=3031323 RepID=UPI0023DC1006
ALRVASEALANPRRHADCRAVTVTCRYGPDALTVVVRDDGRGFDAARVAPEGHHGIAGMRERAAAAGARLDVASAPGRGTIVTLVMPAAD